MARRSARLQKRSPPPSLESTLTSVAETEEPAPQSQTPAVEKHEPTMSKKEQSSQLPQPAAAATPLRTIFSGITARTPKNKTPIKPPGEEMHPEHHHASTAKFLDEARWLGFQALGAHTVPPKNSDANPLAIAQATPTKTSNNTAIQKLSNFMSSPDFKFRFKSPIPGLSPKSSRLVNQVSGDSSGARALFGTDEFSTPIDLSTERKFAVPKGKSSRYSDVHLKQFKKMDSIANHPSTFRADPSRFKPVVKNLKRSPSKAELDKPDTAMKPPATPLKRTRSKLDAAESSNNPPSAKSTIRLVPPSRHGPPTRTADPSSLAKRVKRKEEDDAATTRPAEAEDKVDTPKQTPARRLHSALPRAANRLMTPTRASIARSQSVKAVKSTSMTPSRLPASSTTNLFSPSKFGDTMREGIRKTSNSLQKVKSILRTPQIKYSADPEKIAAGTHMSPPPALNLNKALPHAPSTAPVRKQVNFTESTVVRSESVEVGSPSPSKPRAPQTESIVYPALESTITYPKLPGSEMSKSSRGPTPTFTGLAGAMAGGFDFKTDKPSAVDFGPATKGTIRMVRKSDASSLIDGGRKRKLEIVGETSDKENQAEDREEGPRSKRAKTSVLDGTVTETPRTPRTPTSKLPRKQGRTPGTGGLSRSRLAFLSTPKRLMG